MPDRSLPAAVAGLGLFLVAATVAAVAARAFTPAAVFGMLALVHLGVAAGLAGGSRSAAIVGAAAGALDLALVAIGMAFIVGIETGIGVDLGALWFAPLNGYATIAVSVAIGAVALAMVGRGVRTARQGLVVAAPRG